MSTAVSKQRFQIESWRYFKTSSSKEKRRRPNWKV